MQLSVRRKFGKTAGCDTIQIFSGSWGWDDYLAWIKLSRIEQVRTYDSILNPPGAAFPLTVSAIREVEERVSSLNLNNSCQYLQLAINLEDEEMPLLPEWIALLGYDLAEIDSSVSSLLNCGPWEGELAQFTTLLNRFGLLDLQEVRRAEMILPIVWGQDEPHAFADVWAICEVQHQIHG